MKVCPGAVMSGCCVRCVGGCYNRVGSPKYNCLTAQGHSSTAV